MKCKQARRLFGAYWDDELTQAEREWLEGHFASCSPCRGEYDDLVRTIELASSLPREEVAPGFAEGVLARARRAAQEPDRVPAATTPRWIPVTAAAALLAVLAATVFQWTGVLRGPAQDRTAKQEAVEQPTWIADGQPVLDLEAPAGGSTPAATGRSAGPVASMQDSLFDHGEDVEFILDPVTLRKGRARTVVRDPQAQKRSNQAVITF